VLEHLQSIISALRREPRPLLREGELQWIAPVAPGAFPHLQSQPNHVVMMLQLRPGTCVQKWLGRMRFADLPWQWTLWTETELDELGRRFPHLKPVCRNALKWIDGR